MWLLDRVSQKIKLIYQQFFQKNDIDVINTLPNTFFTVNSIRIKHMDDTVDFDHIIIGPSGIFCIQEVNYPGLLKGDDNIWIHETEKKNSTIKNPFELVNKYIETIKYIIRKNDRYLFNEPLKSDEIPIYPLIINCAASGRMNIVTRPFPVIKPFDLKRIIKISSEDEFMTKDECLKLGKLLMSKNIKKNININENDYR